MHIYRIYTASVTDHDVVSCGCGILRDHHSTAGRCNDRGAGGIFKELVLFLHKIDVLDDPFKQVQLVQLNDADVLRILVETLVAHFEAVFLDQTMVV